MWPVKTSYGIFHAFSCPLAECKGHRHRGQGRDSRQRNLGLSKQNRAPLLTTLDCTVSKARLYFVLSPCDFGVPCYSTWPIWQIHHLNHNPISGSSSGQDYISNFSLQHPKSISNIYSESQNKSCAIKKGMAKIILFFYSWDGWNIIGGSPRKHCPAPPYQTVFIPADTWGTFTRSQALCIPHLFLTTTFEEGTMAVSKIRTLKFREV